MCTLHRRFFCAWQWAHCSISNWRFHRRGGTGVTPCDHDSQCRWRQMRFSTPSVFVTRKTVTRALFCLSQWHSPHECRAFASAASAKTHPFHPHWKSLSTRILQMLLPLRFKLFLMLHPWPFSPETTVPTVLNSCYWIIAATWYFWQTLPRRE